MPRPRTQSRDVDSEGGGCLRPAPLDFEIRQNSWLTVPADPKIIFEVDVEQRWAQAATSLGVDITTLSAGVGHA